MSNSALQGLESRAEPRDIRPDKTRVTESLRLQTDLPRKACPI